MRNGELLDARIVCLLGEKRTEVDIARTISGLTGELRANLGAHLVASDTYRRSQMDEKLVGGNPMSPEGRQTGVENPSRRSLPSGVKQGDYTRRMGDEHRYAVGDGDGESNSLLRRDVSVGFAGTKHSFPAAGMSEHATSVNLAADHDAPGARRQLVLECRPPRHHLSDGIVPGKSEASSVATCGKRSDSEALEVGDLLARQRSCRSGHRVRRSSTRLTVAPRARRRSSIRS